MKFKDSWIELPNLDIEFTLLPFDFTHRFNRLLNHCFTHSLITYITVLVQSIGKYGIYRLL